MKVSAESATIRQIATAVSTLLSRCSFAAASIIEATKATMTTINTLARNSQIRPIRASTASWISIPIFHCILFDLVAHDTRNDHSDHQYYADRRTKQYRS